MTVTSRNCYFLQQALDSIRIQFWRNIELIFCCDIPELVDEINDWLATTGLKGSGKLVDPKLTRAQKFYSLLESAKGEWLVNLDCDDELTGGALATLAICLKVCPDNDYFTSGQVHINVEGEFLKSVPSNPEENTLLALQSGFRQRHLWGFRRDCLSSFSEALKSPYICEDYYFFAKLATRGLIPLCIPFDLCRYRRHSQQLTYNAKNAIAEMTDSIQGHLARELRKIDPMCAMRSAALAVKRREEQDVMRLAVRTDRNPY